MILDERLSNVVTKKKQSIRVRRFKCSNEACDYVETIFADGFIRNVIEPIQEKEQVAKMFKEQEENNQP